MAVRSLDLANPIIQSANAEGAKQWPRWRARSRGETQIRRARPHPASNRQGPGLGARNTRPWPPSAAASTATPTGSAERGAGSLATWRPCPATAGAASRGADTSPPEARSGQGTRPNTRFSARHTRSCGGCLGTKPAPREGNPGGYTDEVGVFAPPSGRGKGTATLGLAAGSRVLNKHIVDRSLAAPDLEEGTARAGESQLRQRHAESHPRGSQGQGPPRPRPQGGRHLRELREGEPQDAGHRKTSARRTTRAQHRADQKLQGHPTPGLGRSRQTRTGTKTRQDKPPAGRPHTTPAEAGGRPGEVHRRWSHPQSPPGAEVKIGTNDELPPYDGTKGSKAGFNTGLTIDEILTKNADNYSSALNLREEAGTEIGHMKAEQLVVPTWRRTAKERGPQGTVNRLAVIVKEGPTAPARGGPS